MTNLCSVLIEGNMVRDPQMRSTPKGTQVCTFTMATNRYFQNGGDVEREVSFFDVETWGKLAERCEQLGKKGRGIRVVGRLKQSRWADTEGKSHEKIVVVAEHVEFRPEFKKTETKQESDDLAIEESQDTEPQDETPDFEESEVVEETVGELAY